MNPNRTSGVPAESEGLSRRQLAKAAAWSLPVVALAVAAPAAAATAPPIVYNYYFSSLTAKGPSGALLTGADGPGAAVNSKPGNSPVAGQAVTFTVAAADAAFVTIVGSTSALTDSDGEAHIDVQLAPGIVGQKLVFMTASWVDTTVTPNAPYSTSVTVKINYA